MASGELEPKSEQQAAAEREQRAQQWIERAARRLDEVAQMEADVEALFPTHDQATDEIQPKIPEQDQEFMAMLKDNWWRTYPHLANLELELIMLMEDKPLRSQDWLFDRQYSALQEAWLMGRAEQLRAADDAAANQES